VENVKRGKKKGDVPQSATLLKGYRLLFSMKGLNLLSPSCHCEKRSDAAISAGSCRGLIHQTHIIFDCVNKQVGLMNQAPTLCNDNQQVGLMNQAPTERLSPYIIEKSSLSPLFSNILGF